MPKQRYERREPTHEWSQIRPLLKDPVQIQYEILRPVVLFGVSPKERATETGVSKTTLYAKANLFDQAGMASLLPPVPPPEILRQDKRTLTLQCDRPSLMPKPSIQDCVLCQEALPN